LKHSNSGALIEFNYGFRLQFPIVVPGFGRLE